MVFFLSYFISVVVVDRQTINSQWQQWSEEKRKKQNTANRSTEMAATPIREGRERLSCRESEEQRMRGKKKKNTGTRRQAEKKERRMEEKERGEE